ncbi:glycosyltransferase [Providencia stuartii]|uniref:glycosyltransferase n=1 Tax=Providencia stuartii TaxID=588 RepID=UPI00288F5B27|nr:glycosyltransferase [Providencia stuartii]MDT2015227.1 glycosyltransferase [Providencia stuartii]MDT2082708.1 glycosyltransferase [Providencia stuartii]HEM6842905.1 glycosyltransferase [Providencia stuartii]
MNQDIRVLHICKNIPIPGFPENNIILQQIEAQNESGMLTKIFYPREIIPSILKYMGGRAQAIININDNFISEGFNISCINYIRLPTSYLEWILSSKLNFYLNKSLANTIKKFSPQIIHAHYIFPDALIAHAISKRYKIPYVISIREGDYFNFNKNRNNIQLARKTIEQSSKIIGITPNLLRAKFLHNSKEIVYNFIHNDFFSPVEKFSEKKKNHITIIAKGIKRKNIDWVVQYVSNHKDSTSLSVIGSGKVIQKLKNKFYSYNNIEFLGKISRPEVIKQLDKSEIFALPSNNETFGMVYAEAAARGNIVVGLEGTGLSGINCKSFYFAKNEQDFISLMDEITNYSFEKKLELSKLSRESAILFSKDIYIDKIRQIYNDVITMSS